MAVLLDPRRPGPNSRANTDPTQGQNGHIENNLEGQNSRSERVDVRDLGRGTGGAPPAPPWSGTRQRVTPPPHSTAERTLIDKLTSAYTAADLDGLLALLADDVRLTMPPHPFEYRGRTVAARGLGQLFAQGHRYRLIETRATRSRLRPLPPGPPRRHPARQWPARRRPRRPPRQRHDHVHPQHPGALRPAQDPARVNAAMPQQAPGSFGPSAATTRRRSWRSDSSVAAPSRTRSPVTWSALATR